MFIDISMSEVWFSCGFVNFSLFVFHGFSLGMSGHHFGALLGASGGLLGLFGGPWGYFGSLCRTLVDNFGCVWGAEGPLAHFAAPWLSNLGAFGAQRVISLFQGQGGIPKVVNPSQEVLLGRGVVFRSL